ncbi:GYF domain-containing protein [Sorangium sp. So ce590]|uniref:GYF domain-containing protein n=1 Tax=Sorangium sp. So ce590 TaxID=3133317 RepID=UPI003F6351E8
MSAWRWTDERGVQRLVSTAELRSALAAGVIPGSTLVWRQGMEAWAPASRLPELADAAQLRRKPEAGAAAPEEPPAGEPARDSSATLELELVEELDPAPAHPGQRTGPAPPDRSANERRPTAHPSRGTARPQPPPPPPRKRESMRTLTGIDVPASAPASGQSAPIVVPSAGGTFDAGIARAITQLPRYDGSSTGDEGAPAIPRAPKLPSASEEHEDTSSGQHPAGDADVAAGGAGATRDGDEPAAPKRAPGAAAPSRPGAAPRAAGSSPRAARPPRPPPLPVGRDAAPAGAAPQNDGRSGADPGAVRPLSATPPAPSSSSRGTKRPAAGRTVPPPPVPVRFPAVPARRPSGAQAPDAPARAAAGAKALVRLGSLPAPPPRPPAEALHATPMAPPPLPLQPAVALPLPPAAPIPPADAAPVSSAAATAALETRGPRLASLASPAMSGDGLLPRSAESTSVDDGRDPSASHAGSEAPEPSTTTGPHREAKEHSAAPVPGETKRSPLPDDTSMGRREYATIPSAGVGAGSPQGSPAARSWPGLPGLQSSQRGPAAADAPLSPGQRSDRSSVAGSSGGAPALDPRALAARRAQPPLAGSSSTLARGDGKRFSTAVPVPVSSLIGICGAAVLMSVAAFFAGRHSVATPRRPPVATARPALGAAQDVARSAIPVPLKPCWVARQPQQWAPLVAKSIPFEVTATKDGKLLVGYAKSAMEAVGLEVDPATGKRSERFSNREATDIVSISPVEDAFTVLTSAQQAIRSPVNVPGPRPFVVGLADGAVVAADNPGATPSRLWPVQGDEPLESPRALAAGAHGYAVAFRREKAVWTGWLDAERRPAGELTRVTGSGGALGKPSLGWNERALAVVFADRPMDGRWEIRAGQAASGDIPASTQVIPLPSGGPGGDAFAPDIAGLSDGRWLLVWTEGPPGSRAMRAQTLAPNFSPIGDPIALSPPAGNFGQGVLGVSPRSGYVGVVFLSKPAASYELWGVILQCG